VVVEENSNVVLGYYTRLPNSVGGESIPAAKTRNSVPVFLLAKAAVNQGLQRQGVGKMLLKHFLESAISHAENEACFAVIVDALDDDAKGYYLQFGFKECADDPMRLYMPMKTVKKLAQ
jgi:predicted N-acetyltransferase YhbS